MLSVDTNKDKDNKRHSTCVDIFSAPKIATLSHLLAVGAGVPGDDGGVALGHHGDILDDAVVAGGLHLLQPRHQQSQEADQDSRHPGRITFS